MSEVRGQSRRGSTGVSPFSSEVTRLEGSWGQLVKD